VKTLCAIAFGLLVTQAPAQPRPELATARSVSGQFVAYPGASGYTSRYYRGDDTSIPLAPAVQVIAAERIKQAAWRQFDLQGSARGKIFLRARPARSPYEQPTIIVERSLGSWAYRIDLPDAVTSHVFVRTLVHACLLEIANRDAHHHAAELPLWLAEGIAQEILATEKLDYLMPSARGRENGLILNRLIVNERRADPSARARYVLHRKAPLTFEQLSWPGREQLVEPEIEVFRASAQMFVRQLMQLKDGRACLRNSLARLGNHRNWQFAFLSGFSPHFKTQLDVEKWWALQVVGFTGRDLAQTFTWEASWEKLDNIVQAPVEVRSRPQEMPRRSQIPLQVVVRDWDGLNQRTALQQKLQQLELLRPRVSQELIGVVDDYRSLLAAYLSEQNFSGSFFGLRKRSGPIRNRVSDSMIRELNSLDARRLALKPAAAADSDPPALSALQP